MNPPWMIYPPRLEAWPPEKAVRITAVVQTAIFRAFGGYVKGQG